MNNPPRKTITDFMEDTEYSEMISEALRIYGDMGLEDYFFTPGEFALYLLARGEIKHDGIKLIKTNTNKQVKLWNSQRRSFA